MKNVPKVALEYPELFRDSVGDEGLAGGTPKRFGGRWDCTAVANEIEALQGGSPTRSRKGPHDCYCEVGFKCFSQAGAARVENYGRRNRFYKELWTNTPGYVQNPSLLIAGNAVAKVHCSLF